VRWANRLMAAPENDLGGNGRPAYSKTDARGQAKRNFSLARRLHRVLPSCQMSFLTSMPPSFDCVVSTLHRFFEIGSVLRPCSSSSRARPSSSRTRRGPGNRAGGYAEGTTTVGADVGQRCLVDLVDLFGGRGLAVGIGAVVLARLAGIRLGLALGKRPGLALASTQGRVELAAQALILGLQLA
jgi:hypothetical protein